jgi:hypothetical protein
VVFEKGELEVIDGLIYGKPVQIGTQTWLDTDLDYYISEEGESINVTYGEGPGAEGQNDYEDSKKACPNGWRLPLKSEFETLLILAGKTGEERVTFFKEYEGFNARVHPTTFENAWISLEPYERDPSLIYILKLTADDVFLDTMPSTAEGESTYFSTRCLGTIPEFSLSPPKVSLFVGESIEMPPPVMTNIIAYSWFVSTIPITTDPYLEYTFDKEGSYEIGLELTFFGDRIGSAFYQHIFVGAEVTFGRWEWMFDCDYGFPIEIGNQIFLTIDLLEWIDGKGVHHAIVTRGNGPGENGENSYHDALVACPGAMKIPTKADFQTLLEHAGTTVEQQLEFFNRPDGWNATLTENYEADYICVDPVPDTDYIWTLSLRKDDVFFGQVYRYPEQGSYFQIRCMTLDFPDALPVEVPKNVGYVGEVMEVIFSPDIANIYGFNWMINGTTVSNEEVFSHTFTEPGHQTVEIEIILFGIDKRGNPRNGRGLANLLIVTEFLKGEEDEIIDGINYGRPVQINEFQVFLDRDLESYVNEEGEEISLVSGKGPGISGGNSYVDSLKACPNGYRLPSLEDFNFLLTSTGITPEERYAFMTHPDGFAAVVDENGGATFICSSPEYESYDITTLKIANGDVLLSSTSSDMNTDTFFQTRCIQAEYFEFELEGLQENDYTVDDVITVAVAYPNALSVHWDFGNSVTADTPTASVIYPTGEEGKHFITCTITLLGEREVTNTKFIWVKAAEPNDSQTALDLTQLKILSLRANAAKINTIYFTYGTAPIATRSGGGFWTVWRNSETNELYAFALEDDGTPILWEDHFMGEGYALDAARTSDGIFVLARDSNQRLSLFGRLNSGEILFNVTIEDNGEAPIKAGPDQVIFYDDEGVPVSGMQAMFTPTSARVVSARDRLAILLAHYNYFGELEDGTRDDRQGDSFFTCDEPVNEFTLGFEFGTSHSLQQHVLFDGDSYITASLGDSEPMNIRVHRVAYDEITSDYDAVHERQNKLEEISEDMVDGLIVGSEDGYSTGRLGGLLTMEYNKNVLIYSRRPINDIETGLVSEEDELALIFFDNQLKVLDKKVIGPGSNVNVIKSAKYGSNILVAYSISSETIWDYYLYPW